MPDTNDQRLPSLFSVQTWSKVGNCFDTYELTHNEEMARSIFKKFKESPMKCKARLLEYKPQIIEEN